MILITRRFIVTIITTSIQQLSNLIRLLELRHETSDINIRFILMSNVYNLMSNLKVNDFRCLLHHGPPLPIPNREVKPDCADGTAVLIVGE